MSSPRVRPLSPGDPQRLGRYTLVGRLGEGGMGTVYLADTPDGEPVAIKVIRPDLAHDDQFRRRFRSEVDRARQVPPFCTAEVLDADTDSETPYLVVEYVDGPSLTAVVKGKGPLSPSNLHGLAIGVATALTAIHGAGVVHRDLKPANVLLAAGSPKVIDFGIAHSSQATTGHTETGQMVGTVSYMAPERFESPTAGSVTPAADIFSWGAVIAYAGLGRNPFGSGDALTVAGRILTQPPDLDGLPGALRALVERALSKDPNDRPTARDLLDHLLTAGTTARSPDVAAALERQPALRHAAHGAAQEAAEEAAQATALDDPETVPAVVPAPVQPPVPAGSRWGRFALVVVALAALVTSLTVAGLVYKGLPGRDSADPPSGAGSTSPSGPAASMPAGPVVVADALDAEGAWQERNDTDNRTTCRFDGALVVTRQSVGSYRCPGVQQVLTDFSVAVDVRLRTPGSCAGIWFRFENSAGYALRVCETGYALTTHGDGGQATVTPLRTFSFPTPVEPGAATRVGIAARGTNLQFFRDGRLVGDWTEDRFQRGRVVLGIFELGQVNGPPPYSVSFADVEIRNLAG
jgi:hypothetical protein